MKNIAIFTERLKVGFGVDLVVHEQAQRLSRTHNVVVFPIEADADFIRGANYPIFPLHIPLAFNPLKQDFNALKAYSVYNHIFQLFDVFIIHTPTFNVWAPLLREYGKVMMYCYGNSPSSNYPFPKSLRKNVLDFMEHMFYFRFASKIISISHFLKNALPKYVQKKTTVIHLGKDHITDAASHIKRSDIEKFKRKYFLKSNEKIVTYIGRLDYKNNPYKNTKMLLKINTFFKEKYGKSFRLIAIGFPENNIEKIFFNHGIMVIPKASMADLVCALRLSKVYISPSLWEGFNLPLLEAQSLGVPAVAYDLAAHPEVISNKKSGFLVRTPREFIEKIDILLQNDVLQKHMSEEALHFSAKFSWKTNVQNLEKII